MKKILIIGAGRSSASLIKYLLNYATKENWMVRVGDMDLSLACEKIGQSPNGEAFVLNASNDFQRKKEIAEAVLVISMLPASMHMMVARDCLEAGKHLITPSYIPDEMWSLDQEAKEKGILFLNEMGVDPGIDHMSAMKIIHSIKEDGGQLTSFQSFTGGLVAPESDDNPWHYKITWNPRNVVLAGFGGTARFLKDNELKFIPYQRLFERIESMNIEPYGLFEGYANRDSLKYRKIYELETIPTLFRGTLRRDGFCAAWNALVQMGLTDDSFQIENPSTRTWNSLTSSFLNVPSSADLRAELQSYLKLDDGTLNRLIWLGLFEDRPLGIESGTPAMALQKLIEDKWKMSPGDKDMIVMWHGFEFLNKGKKQKLISSLVAMGEDELHTAMAKTVGLPIAIAARMILDGRLKLSGIHLPVIPEIYLPVLDELEEYGISFTDQVRDL